jgi:hypothetical protein
LELEKERARKELKETEAIEKQRIAEALREE